MRRVWLRCTVSAAALVALLVLARPALTADPDFPKPGPEHDLLKKLEGTWTATVKNMSEPGKPPKESKGTMVYKMECGGFWLSSNFEGEFEGTKFQGKGLDSYDTAKKKYVMVWVDSMTTTPMVGEGYYDKDSKTMTMIAEGPGPDGKMTKHKMVSVMKDDDNMELTMSIPGKDGKDMVMMSISYKRKK